MTRTTTLLALAVATLACMAADSSPVEEAFGNTIVSTYPDGRSAELWLSPDGSYAGQGRRHDPSSGHWKVTGAKLCLKQARPIPVPFSWCTPLPGNGLSAAWAGKAPTGETIRIALVRGHILGG
ncbi:MAG: hypothetical protein ACRETH_08665 [Steroidobacteraceae bacterium]